ncbi:putative bifunctional diguanylate cyclase/phosphodiesterase [Geodermatophilus nigrescens]|uniref:PAS domain S-box-containing protein/diguanylate cyclase (GGDEF) domain-containing protein n=1 Tax=Geodermatophilus nigrescens TaxID=1070870 RepID=A0A1M5Q6Z0_9ACTN|nr:EAL domain-containing protein [Geodermatophilus nigrescens]SHH09253.1 PAS domain S-box-containing protein/diguanylate cyclase (GGDEF) domain-containing protein [Geodermatophilus nigrescens]
MHQSDHAGAVAPPDLLASVPDAVCHLDREWRFTWVNTPLEELLGRPAHALLGRTALACVPDLRGSEFEDQLRGLMTDGRPRVFEYLHRPRDRWFEVRASADATGLVVFIRDVDSRHREQAAQAHALRQTAAVLDALPSPTVLLDGGGRIRSVNRGWSANDDLVRAAGWQVAGTGDDYLAQIAQGLPPSDLARIAEGLTELRAAPPGSTDRVFACDYAQQLADGDSWWRLQAARVDDSGQLVVTHTDISERVRDQHRLAWQASHDDLTGLPNRARLLELIEQALADDDGRTALLFLDLDGFKTVNDSLGHEVGDELLRRVGARLAGQVRPGDAVGRLGGDQFVVLARSCDTPEAASLAFRLQRSFARPFTAAGLTVPVSASIGVAVAQPGLRHAHQLLSDADAAGYAAKAAGRDRVHLFSPGLRDAARWRMDVANRLRDGAQDQFVVHYQPVVRLDTGEVEGVEALLRWQHPERGLLGPDAFLSVAEETGQLIPITRWLLHETTRQAAEWAEQGLALRMAVNISARHFSAETLVRDVRAALRDSGLAPEQLMLELTETCVAEDPTRAEDQLAVLQGFGVRVAIDDFGTGWSSLAQLMALPIGTLKIDRSLITAAERLAAGGTGAVLGAIVELAHTLGIRSVAEGVETADHLRMVREAGCDSAQGYLLARPMAARDVERWANRVSDGGGDSCALALAGRLG